MRILLLILFYLKGHFSWANCEPRMEMLVERGLEVLDYRPSVAVSGAVVIFPPTGGVNFLDRQYAQSLCREGLRATILVGWDGDDEVSLELQVHNRLLAGAQRALQTYLEWSQEPRVGVLGTSVGALHAANGLNRFEQVQAAFLIAGGAPIAELIATSQESTLTEIRAQRMQAFGWQNIADYQAALTGVLQPEWEPLQMDTVLAKPVGMALALNDETVPTHLQWNLAQGLGAQPVHEFSGGHVWGIIKAWWFLEGEILGFFATHLD